MKLCPKCNKPIEEDAEYCYHCGEIFVKEEVKQQQAAYTPPQPNPNYNAQRQQYAQQPNPNYNAQGQQYAQQPNPNYNVQGQQYAQQPQVNVNVYNQMPVGQLKTDRSMVKVILLSLITFGIYGIVVYSHITDDVNTVCTRYDGQKTMNYCLVYFLLGPLTLEIMTFIWMHKLCNRIGNELVRRGINDCSLSASDYWLWGILGSLILVGPFIFMHKLLKAVNAMNASFNTYG